MIGGAVLIVGLLLFATGLASGLVPGDADFASPDSRADGPRPAGLLGWASRVRSPIVAFICSPIHPATWTSNLAIGIGFWVAVISFSALVGVFSAGVGLLFIGVGLLILPVGIEGSRVVAALERRRAMLADSRPLHPHKYKLFGNGPRDILMAEFADENRWRDVIYVVINMPLAILELAVTMSVWIVALALLTSPIWFDASAATQVDYLGWLFGHNGTSETIRVAAGLVMLPVAASVSQGVMILQRAVVRGMLCTSETQELEQRVEKLTLSRSAVLGVEASELRRIERDLHDGAQQRLVMLTIDLSLASDKIETDPDAARKLVEDARDQARQALAELRDLVRGIAPAILLDRGLPAALTSIAGRSRVPATVRTNLEPGERVPEAIERAAYFVVAESLANVAKHSEASRCEIRCWREYTRLVVEVWDDGKGGARVAPGSGLEGLAGRAYALDGRFGVSSPDGGPTLLRAEFPAPPRIQSPGEQPRPQPAATAPAFQGIQEPR